MIKVCVECEKEFEVGVKYRSQKFCSVACRIRSGKGNGTRLWEQLSVSRKYNRLKSRGLGICSKQDFIEWRNKQENRCHYCHITEKAWQEIKDTKITMGKNWLTIDRKDNSIGYKIDNIVLCCMRCNQVKNSCISYNEMLEIGTRYIKPKWCK